MFNTLLISAIHFFPIGLRSWIAFALILAGGRALRRPLAGRRAARMQIVNETHVFELHFENQHFLA